MSELKEPVDEEIISHYMLGQEEQRLLNGSGILEFARMQELLARHLPRPPKVVLDVGGGAGAYSCWLAREGYQVHLVDPVARHVDQARRASAGQPTYPIASASQGDARTLVQSSETCDAVLLMGPLYHLITRNDRIKALQEAYRVLRSGGMVFAKAINRFASLLDGLVSGLIDDPHFVQILEQDLKDGQHRNPEGIPDYFTTAFFHRPEELESEVSEAGFTVTELVAVQGPGWLAKDLEQRWSDTDRRSQVLNLVRAVEHEPALLGVSQHFVVIATK